MGLLNLFKNKTPEEKPVDEINNEELKQKIKNSAIEMVSSANKINGVEAKNVEIRFQYLVRTAKGIQSMFVLSVDEQQFYFNIANDSLQLLNDSAKQFFDI